jgi:hypothetical protein
MRKIHSILVLAFVMMGQLAKADEGMWLLSLLEKLNYKDMQAKGLRLTPEQLYSVNNSSLKDACIWFNGGCTGELISDKGLILTNHHCGYDAIAALSTPQDNILDNGFWAKSMAEERKPVRSMSITRVVRVDDITDQVLEKLKGVSEEERSEKLRTIYSELTKTSVEGTHYEATCREMFKGNAYYLFVMEVFNDIRLVGTPPQNIGKFGQETDNWMWPRHTGDFSMFRVYVDKDNKPAKYSPENVPYKPLHHLPISIKGVKEGDFAMIIGFPGRTSRFEFSHGVSLSIDKINPNIVNLRDIRLKAWKEEMEQDEATRLQLSSAYAGVANYWKFFDGEAEQLKKNKIYDKKFAEENAFNKWAANKSEYSSLIYDIDQVYTEYKPYALQYTYMRECINSPNIISMSSVLGKMDAMYTEKANIAADKTKSKEEKAKAISKLDSSINAYANTMLNAFKGYKFNERIIRADKKIMKSMMAMYYKNIPSEQWPTFFTQLTSKIKNNNYDAVFSKYVDMVFAKSMFADSNKVYAFFQKPNHKKLLSDPAYQYYKAHSDNYNNNYKEKYETFLMKSNALGRKYIKGLMEMNPNKVYYPDANSSQRLTYGTVRSYNPKDGVHYDYICTLDGCMEKYIPDNYEFDLPERLIELYNKKDFGRYQLANGKMPVTFITDNDITGGNSGSPVMDGDGNLIGLAFDGNWEAMSGNIHFDETYKRTINVDIRYVLWLIDKFGGAQNIINELNIIE